MSQSDLVLSVINDGESYKSRLILARHPNSIFRALEWTLIASSEATRLTKKYGVEFTALEVIDAARELEGYYQEHIKEID